MATRVPALRPRRTRRPREGSAPWRRRRASSSCRLRGLRCSVPVLRRGIAVLASPGFHARVVSVLQAAVAGEGAEEPEMLDLVDGPAAGHGPQPVEQPDEVARL